MSVDSVDRTPQNGGNYDNSILQVFTTVFAQLIAANVLLDVRRFTATIYRYFTATATIYSDSDELQTTLRLWARRHGHKDVT